MKQMKKTQQSKVLSSLVPYRVVSEANVWDAVASMAANLVTDPASILLRYTELGDLCSYQLWKQDKVTQRHIHVDQLPEWLQVLVNLARLGGFFVTSKESPPTQVMWAELDDSQQLVRFIVHDTGL